MCHDAEEHGHDETDENADARGSTETVLIASQFGVKEKLPLLGVFL